MAVREINYNNSKSMDECRLIKVDNDISYIAPTSNPLSANVVVIQGRESEWIYDVGAHPDIPGLLETLNQDSRKVNVVLSHFHGDHIGNLSKIRYDEVYQGRLTYKHTNTGVIIESDVFFQDGDISLHLFPLPSSHAKGCVALEVNEKYCFLGDGVYAMEKGGSRLYNSGLLREQIKVLKSVKADNFMLSHKMPFGKPKDVVIMWLEEIYGRREKNEAYIKV